MKSRTGSLIASFVVLFVCSANAYAGCTNAQFAGTWDVVFSDGNACHLVVDSDGTVITNSDFSQSTCFDPFRGSTVPNSGAVVVATDCSVTFALVVEGFPLEMYGRIAKTRDTGAGIYILAGPSKGSFNMIRVE